MAFLLPSHCPELGHMATPTYKGRWEMPSFRVVLSECKKRVHLEDPESLPQEQLGAALYAGTQAVTTMMAIETELELTKPFRKGGPLATTSSQEPGLRLLARSPPQAGV